VEHFRPKAAFRQSPDGPLERPGYYWLAYDWSNLFLCCEICNRRQKRNHFPLRNPGRRARSHRQAVGGEQPLFVNPATMAPTRYIGFRREVAYPIDDHPVGKATIEALDLNREELREMRNDWLFLIGKARPTFRTLIEKRNRLVSDASGGGQTAEVKDLLERIDAEIRRITDDSAQYASMVRAALGFHG
jgi:hypothetical protein